MNKHKRKLYIKGKGRFPGWNWLFPSNYHQRDISVATNHTPNHPYSLTVQREGPQLAPPCIRSGLTERPDSVPARLQEQNPPHTEPRRSCFRLGPVHKQKERRPRSPELGSGSGYAPDRMTLHMTLSCSGPWLYHCGRKSRIGQGLSTRVARQPRYGEL